MRAEDKLTLLIAEDEESLLIPLRDNLELEGYRVETARDGDEALERVMARKPDLLLLDIMMPKRNGWDVCRALQKHGVTVPIIILSAKDQEVDIVLGLELGADDYITKPFGLKELMARIKAVLRRHQKLRTDTVQPQSDTPITVGAARVDFKRYEVTRNGKSALLTPREFAVLHYLLSRKGEVVSRDELLNEVWGLESYPTTRTVDNHILRIRKVIEKQPSQPKILLSIRAVGYRLLPE